jgi:hypothetical protein
MSTEKNSLVREPDYVALVYRDEIATSLNRIVIERNKKTKQTYFFELADSINTLVSLKYLLNLYLENEISSFNEFKNRLSLFFKYRWKFTQGSHIDYSKNTENMINSLCRVLAEYVTPKEENKYLMPTINLEDAHLNNFNELDSGQYILSDDGKTFIAISNLLETAMALFEQDKKSIFIYSNHENKVKRLSAQEAQRIKELYPEFNKLIELEENNSKRENTTLYHQLLSLRDGLQAGDSAHGGKEFDAGIQANIALAKFFNEFYNDLSDDDKDWLYNLTYDGGQLFGAILDNLSERRKELEKNPISICVRLNGNSIEKFIKENRKILDIQFNFSQMRREEFKKICDSILQKINLLHPLKCELSSHIITSGAKTLITSLLPLCSNLNQHTIYIFLFKNLLNFIPNQIDISYDKILKYKDDQKTAPSIIMQHEAYIDLLYAVAQLATHFDSYPSDKQKMYLSKIFDRLAIIHKISSTSKELNESYEDFLKLHKKILSHLSLEKKTEKLTVAYERMGFSERRVIIPNEDRPSVINIYTSFYRNPPPQPSGFLSQSSIDYLQPKR